MFWALFLLLLPKTSEVVSYQRRQVKTTQSPHFTLREVLKKVFLGEEEVKSELSPTKRFGMASIFTD